MTTIVRAHVFHTPRDPFAEPDALEAFDDGAVAFDDAGRILATGPYADVHRDHPDAQVISIPDGFVFPGLIDTHVHFPQLAIIGAMGLQLLEWLKTRTLPQEARLADDAVARETAQRFLQRLLANGTTTALVFGTHFATAQEIFFEEARASGLRITSGLVVSDRELLPELHRSPQEAYDSSAALMHRWHGQGRLRYAVTPRFSLSCSDGMLEACEAVLREEDRLFFTSHLNENPDEVKVVAGLFPWSRDYLDTYERFSLVNERSVFAHDVHVTDDELSRLGAAGAGIAHCPSSNAFLGSGLFPMKRHLEHRVRVALGTDVGRRHGVQPLQRGPGRVPRPDAAPERAAPGAGRAALPRNARRRACPRSRRRGGRPVAGQERGPHRRPSTRGQHDQGGTCAQPFCRGHAGSDLHPRARSERHRSPGRR